MPCKEIAKLALTRCTIIPPKNEPIGIMQLIMLLLIVSILPSMCGLKLSWISTSKFMFMMLIQKALLSTKTSISIGMLLAIIVSKITEIPAKPKQMTTMCSNFCFNIPILLIIKLPNKPPIEEKSSSPP